jgi:Predicted integral membrane protein
MISISEFKRRALAQLKGNWKEPVLLAFVYFIICAGLGAIPIVGQFSAWVVIIPLACGLTWAMLGFYRGNKKDLLRKLFDPFNDFGRVFLTMFLMGIYIWLWSLLLIIPGIIKSLSYAMTTYILKDRPELGYNDAITLSRQMMDGRKWRYFVLQLSFIGWGILNIFTLGIGTFWLIPYIQTTQAAFYEELKKEGDEAVVVEIVELMA